MRVDFYHLTRDPAERAVAEIAAKAMATGQRMLIVSSHAAQRSALSETLWARPGFLAHGLAGSADDTRQPLLIGEDEAHAANDATIVAFADGIWRETGDRFDRVMLFFDEDRREAARQCWRDLRARDCEKHYFSQESGRWQEKG